MQLTMRSALALGAWACAAAAIALAAPLVAPASAKQASLVEPKAHVMVERSSHHPKAPRLARAQ